MDNSNSLNLNDIFDIQSSYEGTVIKLKKPLKNFIIYDPGLYHTSICKSSISRIDSKDGSLYYRGINALNRIEDNFADVAFDLIFDEEGKERKDFFIALLSEYFVLHCDLQKVLDAVPISIHPMDFLAIGITAASELESTIIGTNCDNYKQNAYVISQVSVIVSYYYCRFYNKKWVAPDPNKIFAYKILECMHPEKTAGSIDKLSKILNLVLILHAEHGQNCSSATVRNIASSKANLYNAIVCGMFAFKGMLHGGASQYVSEMYNYLISSNIEIDNYVDEKIRKKEPIMGFGQRTYNKILGCWDPRVETMFKILNRLDSDFPEIAQYKAIAVKLIDRVTRDKYFIDRNITPNPDLFNCIFYKLFGVHREMNPVMIALGRVSGWLANYREHIDDKVQLTRPCDLYK
jgi:citrate synthase